MRPVVVVVLGSTIQDREKDVEQLIRATFAHLGGKQETALD